MSPEELAAMAPYAAAVEKLAGLLARAPDAGSANSVLAGFVLGNLAGLIPDDKWAQMMSVRERPCKVPNCTCHIQTAALLEALDAQREVRKELLR